jgi:hypothetical protein
MTTTSTTRTAPSMPVRLDFDSHAAGFARALAHLDQAATKELDRIEFDPRPPANPGHGRARRSR